MKLSYIRLVPAFFVLAAFGAATRAQEIDQIEVNIPYDFVVAGKTLPAGSYRIHRASERATNELAISSFKNHTGAILVPSEVESTQTAKPTLTFQRVGDQYFLNKIETGEHVFTIPVPAKANPVIALNNQPSQSTSSSSGAN